MKVKNLEGLIERVKMHFREYLEMHDTRFTASHFTCPNRVEHKNDDGLPSAAFFPGPDSFKCFSCFKGDASIMTKEGLKPIDKVGLKDYVLSIDGKFHKVINCFKKPYNGEFIELNATMPGFLNPTHYHNIFYIDKDCQNLYYRDYTINKKPAKDLKVGDYLVTPIMDFPIYTGEPDLNLDNMKTNSKRNLKIRIDEDFCKFLGLFIAEGNTNGKRAVCLTFHKKEKDLIEFVYNFAKFYNLNPSINYKKTSSACTVTICNTQLAKWLHKNCGHTSKNKIIPTQFLGLKDTYLKEIIKGIQLGDGHKRTSRTNTITTISKELSHQLYLLGVKYHKYPSVTTVKEHTPKRDGILRQTAYHITLRDVDIRASRISHKTYKTGGFYLKTNKGEVYCKRIRAITTYKEEASVYNITVDWTHNYTINGMSVANCESSGDIFTAAEYLEGKPLTGSGFITDNVLYLADLFGEEYEVLDRTEDEIKKEALYKALEDTCMLSSAVLQSDNPDLAEVKDYITARGWESLIEEFDFGYCTYQKLIDILKKRGHTEDILMDVGLVPPKESTGTYEKYLLENRLIFPIRNNYGKIIAFASRLIKPPKNENEQKYLQSRNTSLYNKNSTLFNLDKARLSNKIYIVEGYADVFTLYKHGIDNVVALCGLSFNDTKYKLLVQNSIKEIVFCLDNDEAGIKALNRIVDKELRTLSGIDVSIKIFPQDCIYKDVDEYINAEGIDAFNELSERTIFEFKLDKLINDKDDIIIKNDIIQLIVEEQDYTKKEAMCNKLSAVIEISSDAIKKEVDRHAKLEKGRYLTTSEDILEELNCFERVVNEWDRKIWNRRSSLLGLNAKRFPLFTKFMDGVQNMFYLIAADTNVGKSALLLNLALDLIESNDDVFVLFFSVDDSISQLLPRMVALDKDIAINTVSNPKFKIQLNDAYTQQEKEDTLLDRTEGINKLKNISDRFAIKEESQAKKIEDINKYIQIYKKIAGTKQLVVFIDNLHRITSYKKQETRELYMGISDNLKLWKTEYDIPVIATAELKKTYHNKRPVGDDIKETKDLQFDADLVALLFADFYTNKSTSLKFITEEKLPEGADVERPIVEMNIIKNKTSVFKKRLYYKFYPEYSKYVEMTRDEIEALQRSFNV